MGAEVIGLSIEGELESDRPGAEADEAPGAVAAEVPGPQDPPPISIIPGTVEQYGRFEPEPAVDTWVSALEEEAPAEDDAPAERAARIREVALLPLERVTHVFAPQDGLVAVPPSTGQMLVLTSQRLIAFCRGGGPARYLSGPHGGDQARVDNGPYL